MELRVEKVRSSKRKQEIQDMYYASFSKEERMPFGLMVAMSYLRHTDFLAFYDGEVLCGWVYMATMGRQTFIMFFAVDERLRSRGYGSQILQYVETRYPQNVLLVSIEPCIEACGNRDLRLKRKAFYRRNGFGESGYFMKLAGQEQEILVRNGPFDKRRFRRFFILYSNCTVIPKIWSAES